MAPLLAPLVERENGIVLVVVKTVEVRDAADSVAESIGGLRLQRANAVELVRRVASAESFDAWILGRHIDIKRCEILRDVLETRWISSSSSSVNVSGLPDRLNAGNTMS